MEEEILFKIELPGVTTAFANLERAKASIISLREEQKSLNDAYKKGIITLEEYSKESVRVDQVLKTEQKTYSDLTKQVQGTKSKTDELITSNTKLTDALSKVHPQANSVISSLSSMLNPITAVAAGVGALIGLYAKSTIGAKDLEFASHQLSAAFGIVANSLGTLVSSAEDGEGIFSRLTNAIIFSVSPTVAALSKLQADLQEKQEDLNREAKRGMSEQQDLLADNAEILQKVADSQVEYTDKLFLTGQAIDNIRKGSEEVKRIREEELEILEQQLALDGHNEVIQEAILDKKLQIAQEDKKTERQVNAIIKLQDNLAVQEEARLEARQKANDKLLELDAKLIEDLKSMHLISLSM